MRTWMLLAIIAISLIPVSSWAGETKIVLRDYLKEQWTNELLTYPFSATKGACDARSVTITGPRSAVPVQLSEVEYWPGTPWVKSGKLSFIASLAPLTTDTYTVRFGEKPADPLVTDLQVTPGKDQVEITTKGFGVRLLLGEQTFAKPVSSSQMPAPVVGMRLGDGTWFGGSQMYGPTKLASYAAKLTDSGPVFARVAVRYTYINGNTLDFSVRVVAGDNTMRLETHVQQHQPKDGFNLVMSRGLPPLTFLVQHEGRREEGRIDWDAQLLKRMQATGSDWEYKVFKGGMSGGALNEWAEVPLKDYLAPKDQPAGLITALTPWRINHTFALTAIRLRLADTTRELQLRAVDPGAWVLPRNETADPAQGRWLSRGDKDMCLVKDPSGEVLLQVNAAGGTREWTVSDCRSMLGVTAFLNNEANYKPESAFPPETRPLVGNRLNEVKDYVLEWPGDSGKHPHLFMSRAELEERWKSLAADPAQVETLAQRAGGSIRYSPGNDDRAALSAYLLSGGNLEVAAKTHLLDRLRRALQYDLSPSQFSTGGAPAVIIYDTLIDSSVVPEAERPLLRARMAYFGYRLTDPGLWSVERGYDANLNMTVCWELSRGLLACAIPEHPMAKTWFRSAERIMDDFLNQVGPTGEWSESLGWHGNPHLLLAFALA
ncbi:MAG TPA: hypothetical protein VGM23_03020, partial [Armatimonadota bacterium]